MDVDYQKYLKYKTKYFKLKKLLQVGGDSYCERKQKEMIYDNKSPFGTILLFSLCENNKILESNKRYTLI